MQSSVDVYEFYTPEQFKLEIWRLRKALREIAEVYDDGEEAIPKTILEAMMQNLVDRMRAIAKETLK